MLSKKLRKFCEYAPSYALYWAKMVGDYKLVLFLGKPLQAGLLSNSDIIQGAGKWDKNDIGQGTAPACHPTKK